MADGDGVAVAVGAPAVAAAARIVAAASVSRTSGVPAESAVAVTLGVGVALEATVAATTATGVVGTGVALGVPPPKSVHPATNTMASAAVAKPKIHQRVRRTGGAIGGANCVWESRIDAAFSG